MKKQLTIAVLAGLFATSTAVAATDSLVDRQGEFVKDRQDECVLVRDGVPGCGTHLELKDMTLQADAFFDFDKTDIRPEGRAVLEKLAQDLSVARNVQSIDLIGHTDSVGRAAYNQGLSERRANAVRDFLVSLGVNPAMITASGQGATNPIASNETAEGRAQNRRVDVRINAQKKVEVAN